MPDQQTTDVLSAILEMMKQQAIYLHRLHGWLIAVADTVETNSELDAFLKKHPFYNLGPRPDVQITQSTIESIAELVQKLNQPQ
jgi:hypothetical protein